jgi:lipid II isoglutaminyl synthase (glutamine-hydrolysing)
MSAEKGREPGHAVTPAWGPAGWAPDSLPTSPTPARRSAPARRAAPSRRAAPASPAGPPRGGAPAHRGRHAAPTPPDAPPPAGASSPAHASSPADASSPTYASAPDYAPVTAYAPAAAGGPSELRIVWVYPDLLSTYGDRGNLLVLRRRAQLRGISVADLEINSDQRVPRDGDIYLLGGGEDLPQILAARRLADDGGLRRAADHGAVIFAVCAGYQVLGRRFGGVDGEPVDGLGILDISSGRGERRGVGEIVADVDPELGVDQLTGFENHQGVTSIGPDARPLAQVRLGVGNGDGTEGAYAGRVLGTYLHGPALVRNPSLADLLLSWVAGPLPALPDADEDWARQLRSERLAATAESLAAR